MDVSTSFAFYDNERHVWYYQVTHCTQVKFREFDEERMGDYINRIIIILYVRLAGL